MTRINESDYEFSRFETEANAAVDRGAAAAVPAPKKTPRHPLRRVHVKKKNRQQAQEALRARLLLVMTVSIIGVLMSFWCLHLDEFARSNELNRQIAEVENKIEVAKSESTRLRAEMNELTGFAKVDEYATKILGMILPEWYQVTCIDLSEGAGDEVLFAGK